MRIGKRVTQEEFAEHLGISRGWYSRFEGGAPAAFSIHLLSRLGDMLSLSPPERAELMRLAMPELAPVVPWDSSNLYKALREMRRAVKRMWTATSEAEIFQLAGEEARRLLPEPEIVWVRQCLAQHDVTFPRSGLNAQAWQARHESARADLLSRLTPEQKHRLDAVWQQAAPGDIHPFTAYPPDIVLLMEMAWREHGVALQSTFAARIRCTNGGSSGLVGIESARPRDVTHFERTMMSTIAGFASLALH